MRHEDYVNSLVNEDPFQKLQLMAARAAQDFDAAVATAMEDAEVDLHELANRTHIAEDRLQDLLDGDSPYVEEMLLLCHALQLDVHLDRDVRLKVERVAQPSPRDHVLHVR